MIETLLNIIDWIMYVTYQQEGSEFYPSSCHGLLFAIICWLHLTVQRLALREPKEMCTTMKVFKIYQKIWIIHDKKNKHNKKNQSEPQAIQSRESIVHVIQVVLSFTVLLWRVARHASTESRRLHFQVVHKCTDLGKASLTLWLVILSSGFSDTHCSLQFRVTGSPCCPISH